MATFHGAGVIAGLKVVAAAHRIRNMHSHRPERMSVA